MIGFQNDRNGKTTMMIMMMMMINKVNTMTPRQNDLVVKKNFFSLIGMAVGNGHSVLRKKHRSFANLEIGQQ